MQVCRKCGRSFKALGWHLGKSPACMLAYVNFDGSDSTENQEMAANLEKDHYHRRRLQVVFKLVAEFFWFRYVSSTILAVFNSAIREWVSFAIDAITPQLHAIVLDDDKVQQIVRLMQDRFDFLRGLETEAKLKRYASTHFPILEPVKVSVGPGEDDYSCNIMIYQWITILMRSDDEARAEIIAASDLMKSGALLERPTAITSWMHGSVFRQHSFAQPYLEQASSRPVVRVVLILGHDGVELSNPLGQQAGVHNVNGVYGAIGNLPAPMRFQHCYMAPIQTVNERVLKRCDPIRVLAGADPMTGEFIPGDFSSIGAQSRTERFLTKVAGTH
jgi:hypothetical protein